VGSVLLLLGPSFWRTLENSQIYYCLGFGIIAFGCLVALNVYLVVRKEMAPSGLYALFLTAPACFALVFFSYAYLNNLSLNIPLLPMLPLNVIYSIIVACVILLVMLILIEIRYERKSAVGESAHS
jgi:hypothetical protein